MANLRRHFNFTAKSSLHQEPFCMSSASKLPHKHFDKHRLMNDICNSLDLCCSYIQALNSLCGAGSSLARSMFHTVRDVPTYHSISQQFLSMWEEVSKATAGASAAVKTETLMMLQEALNTLEMSSNDTSLDDTVVESFQVIGSCLCSFIELQAQFSWSTWKSLSKLSKTFANDSFRQSLQLKTFDRNASKLLVNTDLNATVKKHFSQLFCKVGIPKVNEPAGTTENQFYTSSNLQGQQNIPMYSSYRNENVSHNASAESVWSPSTTVWASSDCSNVHYCGPLQPSKKDSPNSALLQSDLDEVINLLSCVPVHHSDHKVKSQNQSLFSYPSSSDQMYHLLPKGSMTSVARHLGARQSWSKEPRDIALGYDSWIWRIDNMNCSAITNPDVIKMQNDKSSELYLWEIKELQKWNASTCETGSSSDDGSSVHGLDSESFPCGLTGSFNKHLLKTLPNRRSTSSEIIPGSLENISEYRNEDLPEVQSKISTWPLKQPNFRITGSEGYEKDNQKNPCFHFT